MSVPDYLPPLLKEVNFCGLSKEVLLYNYHFGTSISVLNKEVSFIESNGSFTV